MVRTYNGAVSRRPWHGVPCGYEEGGRSETGSKGITNVGSDFPEKCLVVREPVQNLSLRSDVMVGPERHYQWPCSEFVWEVSRYTWDITEGLSERQ